VQGLRRLRCHARPSRQWRWRTRCRSSPRLLLGWSCWTLPMDARGVCASVSDRRRLGRACHDRSVTTARR